MNKILELHSEGRLTRRQWHGKDSQGRELLCLYTALANDPEARPETCPASLAPRWIAKLMPSWDDNGTPDAWSAMVLRVGALAPRFGELIGRRNDIALAGCMVAVLSDCRSHNPKAVDPVIALLQRIVGGVDVPTKAELKAARAAAAAYAAAAAAAAAAADAAYAAAAYAADAAYAAYAAAAYAAYAAYAARAKAWDRITTGMLDAIEYALNAEPPENS